MVGRMKVGDLVEVRPEVEILRTLDEKACLEGLPFMPEMLQFCGLQFRVYKRAHKTCDSVARRSRRMERTVHLDIRCSGEGHGGCQAKCLLFWKEAWLRPVGITNHSVLHRRGETGENPHSTRCCTRQDVFGHTILRDDASQRYLCQATEIRNASTAISRWDIRQFIEDLSSGNVGIWRLTCGAVCALWLSLSRAGIGLGPCVRWVFDHLHPIWKGYPFPRRLGRIPHGQRTPVADLRLTPGESVRVRSIEQIEQTLDTAAQNRGLYFDPEMVPYVDGIFRVAGRVERMISEETGRMLEFKTPSVALESVVCQGRYSSCRMFCPKSSYALWREAWLERTTLDSASIYSQQLHEGNTGTSKADHGRRQGG